MGLLVFLFIFSLGLSQGVDWRLYYKKVKKIHLGVPNDFMNNSTFEFSKSVEIILNTTEMNQNEGNCNDFVFAYDDVILEWWMETACEVSPSVVHLNISAITDDLKPGKNFSISLFYNCVFLEGEKKIDFKKLCYLHQHNKVEWNGTFYSFYDPLSTTTEVNNLECLDIDAFVHGTEALSNDSYSGEVLQGTTFHSHEFIGVDVPSSACSETVQCEGSAIGGRPASNGQHRHLTSFNKVVGSSGEIVPEHVKVPLCEIGSIRGGGSRNTSSSTGWFYLLRGNVSGFSIQNFAHGKFISILGKIDEFDRNFVGGEATHFHSGVKNIDLTPLSSSDLTNVEECQGECGEAEKVIGTHPHIPLSTLSIDLELQEIDPHVPSKLFFPYNSLILAQCEEEEEDCSAAVEAIDERFVFIATELPPLGFRGLDMKYLHIDNHLAEKNTNLVPSLSSSTTSSHMHEYVKWMQSDFEFRCGIANLSSTEVCSGSHDHILELSTGASGGQAFSLNRTMIQFITPQKRILTVYNVSEGVENMHKSLQLLWEYWYIALIIIALVVLCLLCCLGITIVITMRMLACACFRSRSVGYKKIRKRKSLKELNEVLLDEEDVNVDQTVFCITLKQIEVEERILSTTSKSGSSKNFSTSGSSSSSSSSSSSGCVDECEVFLCIYKEMESAVKFFRSFFTSSTEQLDIFSAEVRKMLSLAHMNIVVVYGGVYATPRVGIVIDYIPITMRQIVVKKTSISQKLHLLGGIVDGMAYLHENNVLHRNLKTHNVHVKEGNACILDWGPSKVFKNHPSQKSKSVGKNFYLSPEVTMGKPYSEKADVYSFSIILYELLFRTVNPFGKLKANSRQDSASLNMKVALRNLRPKVDRKKVPQEIHWLIELMCSCWIEDDDKRPSFQEIKSNFEQNV